MLDDTVLSQPPPKSWVVTIKGHFEDVDRFYEEVCRIFKGLHPQITYTKVTDEDLTAAIICMDWNSKALTVMLRDMVPNELQVTQRWEEKSCQEITT